MEPVAKIRTWKDLVVASGGKILGTHEAMSRSHYTEVEASDGFSFTVRDSSHGNWRTNATRRETTVNIRTGKWALRQIAINLGYNAKQLKGLNLDTIRDMTLLASKERASV